MFKQEIRFLNEIFRVFSLNAKNCISGAKVSRLRQAKAMTVTVTVTVTINSCPLKIDLKDYQITNENRQCNQL